VTASSADLRKTTVSDSTGSYEVTGLPNGVYTVAAALSGFVTGARADVAVAGPQGTTIDFTLCPAALEFIDWIVPPDLNALWTQADVVALVEIAATRPVRGECPSRDVEHTAAIREILKDGGRRMSGSTVTFVQPNWSGERTPYPPGQELIVFLTATPQGFHRVAGPTSAFVVQGERVLASYYLGAGGTTKMALLAKLRALSR
jgi:hypothetical protein